MRIVVLLSVPCAIEMSLTDIVELHLKYGTYTVVYAIRIIQDFTVNQQNIDLGTVEDTLHLKKQEIDLKSYIDVWNVEWTATMTGSITYAIHC